MKTCTGCKLSKSSEEFYKAGGYLKPHCKTCEKIIKATWYQQNKEFANIRSQKYQSKNRSARSAYLRKWRLKNVYKITQEEYDRLLTEQSNCCAICLRPQSELKVALCVDHCHKSNKVRGLLCSACNVGIGYLDHQVDYLKQAIKYLETFNETN